MITIGIHTQPKYAANETSALASVYDFAVKKFKVKVHLKNILLLFYFISLFASYKNQDSFYKNIK